MKKFLKSMTGLDWFLTCIAIMGIAAVGMLIKCLVMLYQYWGCTSIF